MATVHYGAANEWLAKKSSLHFTDERKPIKIHLEDKKEGVIIFYLKMMRFFFTHVKLRVDTFENVERLNFLIFW